jgi:hypothetical protein
VLSTLLALFVAPSAASGVPAFGRKQGAAAPLVDAAAALPGSSSNNSGRAQHGGVVCNAVQEQWPQKTTMRLVCPVDYGGTITGVLFASFGGKIDALAGNGMCDYASAQHSPCHFPQTKLEVEKLCTGKATCEIPFDAFTDPCPGRTKWLSVAVTCGQRGYKVPEPVAKSARQQGKARLRAEWESLASYAKEPGANSSLSMRQSMGFFDVPDREWQLRAAIALDQSKRNLEHSKSSSDNMDDAAAWWNENWHASWSCAAEVRLGVVGDGGKWVCDPNRVEHSKCLVWSVGSAGDFGFEESIHEELGCEIHTFDMGDYEHLAPSFVNYHQWGLSAVASVTKNGAFKTLEDSLRELGQLDRKIDIFKIDIEGAEFQVLTPMLQQAENYLARNVRQILVEVHPLMIRGIGKKEQLKLAHTLMMAILENGFYVYHKEPNTFGCYGSCLEIAVVRLDLPLTQAPEPWVAFRGFSADSGPAQLRQLIFERQMLLQSMQPGDGWFPMGVSKDTVIPKYQPLLHEYAQRGSAWYREFKPNGFASPFHTHSHLPCVPPFRVQLGALCIMRGQAAGGGALAVQPTNAFCLEAMFGSPRER